MWAGRPRAPGCSPLPESLPTGTVLRPFQRPDRSLKADWLDERSTSWRSPTGRSGNAWNLPTSVGGGLAPTDRPLHHPRPGIYNAVLRSDLWALPALGTGHRLGIQNAPAGGPSQITDHNKLYIISGERGTVALRHEARCTFKFCCTCQNALALAFWVCPPNGWHVPLLLWHASRVTAATGRRLGASARLGVAIVASATRLDSTLSQELPHALAQVIHLLKKHSDGCSVPSE